MGKIKSGILGGFSGKVGSVVGTSWKGIDVMKARPVSVANPRTPAQNLQRGKMREIVSDARLLLASIIQPFWNPFAQQQSGYNAFVSENIGSYNETGISAPADMFMTRGSLLGVAGGSVSVNAATNTVTLTYTDNSGQADALATDELVLVVYNETTDTWSMESGQDTRNGSPHDFVVSEVTAGDVLHVWAGFARPNVTKVSDSSYYTVTA